MSDNLFKTENVIAIVLAIIVVIIFTIPVILLFLSGNTNAALPRWRNPRLTNAQTSLFTNVESFPQSSAASSTLPILIIPSPLRRSPPTGVTHTPRPILIIPRPLRRSPPTGVTQTPRPILNAENLNFNKNPNKIKKNRRSSKA